VSWGSGWRRAIPVWIVHPDAAGIDVGNQRHFVAVAGNRDVQPVREFGCWTSDLVKMAQWLKGCSAVTHW